MVVVMVMAGQIMAREIQAVLVAVLLDTTMVMVVRDRVLLVKATLEVLAALLVGAVMGVAVLELLA
jgi:hypothetical protein